jgi:hypothetical protein
MARTLVPRFLAAMELSTFDDVQLHALAGDIALAAKTSALVLASPTMQACVADLAVEDGNLATANKAVADDHIKLRVDIASEAVIRSDLIGKLRVYGALVAHGATSPAAVHGAGLPPQPPRAPRGQAPTVPVTIDNRPPKSGHGKTTVSVHETGPTRHEYVAEQSLDGINFTPLGVSRGKTRVVTGVSGANVWVRFAMVRGRIQSDWSTAVMITIP